MSKDIILGRLKFVISGDLWPKDDFPNDTFFENKKITRSKQKICNENGSERRVAFARIFGQNVEEALCHDPVRVGPGHGLDLKAWALKMVARKLGASTYNSLIKAWWFL